MTSNFNYLFKFIIVGDSSVGKSNLLLRYLNNKFEDEYQATIGVEFGAKNIAINNINYRIQLWDLAGQDKNAMITKIFAKDAHGVIVLCDATNKQTREETTKWKASVDESSSFLDGGKLPCILVENKIDLVENEPDDGELKSFSDKNDFIGCFRASAKTGENINESMEFLIKNIIKRMEDMNKNDAQGKNEDVFDKNKRTSVRLDNKNHTNVRKGKNGGCC